MIEKDTGIDGQNCWSPVTVVISVYAEARLIRLNNINKRMAYFFNVLLSYAKFDPSFELVHRHFEGFSRVAVRE